MSRRHDNRDRSRDRHGYRGRSESPPDVQLSQCKSNEKKKKSHHQSTTRHPTTSRPQGKRVKFNDVPDIKVFRKQDEPNTKGLTEADLEEYMKKIENERGSNAFASSNSERMKHFDAQLQNNSIKEQKQKQKILHDKLQGVKEQIPFYTPSMLRLANSGVVQPGEASTERTSLSDRLNDVLSCYYPGQHLIPSEPPFQIQNKAASAAPKLISFDKQRINNKDLTNTNKKIQKKDQKPLKGILKMTPEERARERSESAPRRIDPNLIALLKQMQTNKAAYPKERAEILLKPYKDSGELDYLKNNPNVLTELMRGMSVSNSVERTPNPASLIPASGVSKPGPMADPYKPRYSISPQPQRPPQPQTASHDMNKNMPVRYNQFDPNQPQPGGYPPNYAPPVNKFYPNYPPNYRPQPQPYGSYNPGVQGMQPLYSGNPYPSQPSYGYQSTQPQSQSQQQQQSQYMANRNYKTVPCKYFHSPQGCVKSSGCTFIHDQEFAGRPTPSMLKSNRGMVMTSYSQPEQQGYYQGYPPDYQRQ